jgi:1-acyl-sn-glycerol-3-phosphate acyltransferase
MKRVKMKPFYRFSRLVCKGLVKAWFNVEISGEDYLPERGPAILASNHLSWWDVVIEGVYNKEQLHFVTKKELLDIPVLRCIIKNLEPVIINRDKVSVSFLKECKKIFDNEGIMLIYPEGKRSKDNRLGEFKEGVERISILYDVPIIPIGIRGTHKYDRQGFHTRYKVTLNIGRPLFPYDYIPDEYKWGNKYDLRKCDGKKLLNDLWGIIYSLSNPSNDAGGLEHMLNKPL